MSQLWKIQEYTVDEITKNIEKNTFSVPEYQRDFVWSKTQQDSFIDTIKQGFPFGTILLYHFFTEDRKECFNIIDGVQRCTTIKNFISEPGNFFQISDVDDTTVTNLCYLTGNIPSQNLKDDILKLFSGWVKKHKKMDEILNLEAYEFAVEFISKYPNVDATKISEIISLIKRPLAKFRQNCLDFRDVQIPAIILDEHSKSVLPDIFERINSTGSKLSKYDIYAASWYHDEKYKITSPFLLEGDYNIVKYNKERIDERSANINVESGMEDIKKKELNLFQICFGFGKLLSKKYPYLFTHKNSIGDVESSGFLLINSCLGGHTKDLSNLNKKIADLNKKKLDINKILEKILDAVEYTNRIVKKYNSFKLNTRSQSSILHSELQIISFIASVFIAKYATIQIDESKQSPYLSLSLEKENGTWKEISQKIEENGKKVYILDIINGRWKGSGDNKLDKVIYTPEYYTRDIDKDLFAQGLESWFKEEADTRHEIEKPAAPQEAEKIFLAMIYLNGFAAQDQLNGSKYDIEHLAPKKLMSSRLNQYNGFLKLPISSIGNLCLLPEYENRRKKDETIYYDDPDYLEKTKSKLSLQEIEEKFSFTSKEDLEWIYDKKLDADSFSKEYRKFIEKRFGTMLNKIMDKFDNL